MSSEYFEDLKCLVDPGVNKKNAKFRKYYKCEGTLGNNTEIPCNWGFVLQRDVPVESFREVSIVN
jgi:hypothetical protein